MFLRKMKGGRNMESYVEQFWTMVIQEQIAPKYGSLYAMKQALQAVYPQKASSIAQAYEIVRKQLIGS